MGSPGRNRPRLRFLNGGFGLERFRGVSGTQAGGTKGFEHVTYWMPRSATEVV